MRSALSICIFCCIVVACSREPITVSELAGWVRNPENGLVDTLEVGPLVFSMQYLPERLLSAVARIRRTGIADMAGVAVFELGIRRNDAKGYDPVFFGIAGLDAFTDRMESLAFSIAEDVQLKLGDRTVNCSSAMFQQDIGLRESRLIRLVFPIAESELIEHPEVAIQWKDRAFGTGAHLFQCSFNAMRDIPAVVESKRTRG